MKLTTKKRLVNKKSEVRILRNSGHIPAIVYSYGKPGIPIGVDQAQFQAHLRKMPKGHLPVTRFSLEDEKKNETKVIVKDIQYNITTYDIIHLDFEELTDDRPVNVKVPIDFVGQAECVGVKIGGVVRQVIRHLKIRCLPKYIPTQFIIDIRELGMLQSKRLSAINLPEGVRSLEDLNEVVVVIAKR